MSGRRKKALLRAKLQLYKAEPWTMVRQEFHVEPDAWQLEALRLYPISPRLALKACKGPGKTAVLAWIILNFLLTRRNCRIGCVSITEANLNANLWPELKKWMDESPLFTATFTWTKTKVENKRKPATWWAQARSWPKQADKESQSNALAGLHEDFVMWVLDESGGIPQAVMTTAEAIFSSCIEGHVIQAGNPTHTTGPLHTACTTQRHLWAVVTITGDPDDPLRSPRIKLEYAQEQIALYGRDNPWVMVNILGQFPPASINALLGVEEVEAAMKRQPRPNDYDWAQKRLGVDAARFGDDPWVIFPRQGTRAFRPVVMRNPRTTEVASRIGRAVLDWGQMGGGDVEMILIDDTGHWGHGCVDLCMAAGLPVVPVIYSTPSTNKRYKTVRDEIWLEMADWVKNGGALPYDVELLQELTVPTYTFIGGKFVVEPKDQVKERLGRSPNKADALATSFALPEAPGAVMERLKGRHRVTTSDSLEAMQTRALTEDDYAN